MRRYIGTFHKTGSVLWYRILKSASISGGITPFYIMEGVEPDSWDVGMHYHANVFFSDIVQDKNQSRYSITIRDPRDVVVSSAYYHCHSEESWLHEPNDSFGGQTYQERLLSLKSMDERFIFEMQQSALGTITQMTNIPFSAPNLKISRWETLVTDQSLKEYQSIFEFLDFDEQQVTSLLGAAWRNSLFSGKVNTSSHIRSGRPRQWVDEFSDEVNKEFDKRFPGVVRLLGYES